MKHVPRLAAVLALCLAATTAQADIAAPQPEASLSGLAQSRALEALQTLNDATETAARRPGHEALAAEVKSHGPSALPVTVKGVESGTGSVTTIAPTLYAGGSLAAEVSYAGAPGQMGVISHEVGSGEVVTASDLASLIAPTTSPQLLGNNVQSIVLCPVPVPPALLLLGGGLLGMLPLRRSLRQTA